MEDAERLLDFIRNAGRQEFCNAAVAVLKRLKIERRKREDFYCWLIENRPRFADLVSGENQPRGTFERSVVARARRELPQVLKYFHEFAEQGRQAAGAKPQPSQHWALEFLEQRNLEPYLEELQLEGYLERLPDDWEPLAGLGLKPPEPVPLWFPQQFQGRVLSPSERLAWFDELLRDYCDSPETWPLTDDENLKTRRLLTSLYRMYQEWNTGLWPAPSFIHAKPSKRAHSPESLTPS